MQVRQEDYNPLYHDKGLALTVENPDATHIANGVKTWYVSDIKPKEIGWVHIASALKPDHPNMLNGAILCKVYIGEVKRVALMSESEWYDSNHPVEDKDKFKNHYAWKLEHVRRMVEFPITYFQYNNVWPLYFIKDVLIEYPLELESISSRIREKGKKEKRSRIKKIFTYSCVIAALLLLLLLLIFT